MDKKGVTGRTRKVTIRFTESEYKRLHASFKNTTNRKLSEYTRSVLLDKTITVYTRNKSYDDFVAEMISLRRELKAIGNNFNQAVKKLHTLDTNQEVKTWAVLNENSKQMFFQKIEEIHLRMIQIQSKWSRE